MAQVVHFLPCWPLALGNKGDRVACLCAPNGHRLMFFNDFASPVGLALSLPIPRWVTVRRNADRVREVPTGDVAKRK